MAIGRISGSVLKSNLTRNGTDLAFETNLLYLDVTNSRIGIGTSEPTTALQVAGTIVSTGLTVDTNTLHVDSANNRVGIGTASPAYQVEIENTGSNALLVLDRTDGAACFIEGQSTRSAFGSVGATPLALAYNSAAVVTIGENGAITVNPDGDGFTLPTTDGTAGQVLATDGAGNVSFTDLSIGDLTVIGSTITTPSNADLTLDPGGTGNVVVGASANFIQGTAHTISSEDATGTYVAKQYLLWGETTNATETEIFVGGVTNARIPVGSNTTINYSVQVVARRTDATGESAAWELKALADSFSGTVANVGNVYEVIVARDDENWLVDARADDTNNSVGIYVTGAAGKTIRWVAEVETSEVSE